MKNYLRLLKPNDVYLKHELFSTKLMTLEAGKLIPYTREKRRSRVNWMEIFLDDGSLAYIMKETDNLFLCEKVHLLDEYAEGFDFTYKTNEEPPMRNLFRPVGTITPDRSQVRSIRMKSVGDKEDKTVYVTLEYLADLIDVTPIRFNKGEELYIIFKGDGEEVFIEVDDLEGKRGFLLKQTNTEAQKDSWIAPLGTVIAVLTVIGIIAAFYEAGWIVISGLMIIPAIIVSLISVFVVQIVLMILRGLFHQVRKRL